MNTPITHQFTFDGCITAEQKAFYEYYGFIHFRHLLTGYELSVLETMLSKVYEQVLKTQPEKINGIPIRYGQDEYGAAIVQRLPHTAAFNKEIAALLMNKGIASLAALTNRPDCRLGFDEKDGLVTNYFINTPGSTYRQMGWHTDGLRELLLLQPLLPMINVGFYLDDSGISNGGLRIIPGSHRSGLAGMFLRKMHLLDKNQDEREFCITASKGDMVLHDGRLWHRVALSPQTGKNSRRRVMYAPLVCGKEATRHCNSDTPLYHKINRFTSYQ